MKPAWRFVVASTAMLGIWAAADAAYVLAGQPKSGTEPFDYVFFPVGYLVFLWAAWPLFPSRGMHTRQFLRMLCAFAAFAVWFLPAMLLLVQFHVAIGGAL